MSNLTMERTSYVKLLILYRDSHLIDHNMRDEKYFYLTRDKNCYVMLHATGTLK